MAILDQLLQWVEAHERLLSGLAALVVVLGVFVSPLGAMLRKALRRQPEEGREGSGRPARPDDADRAAENELASIVVLPFDALSQAPEDAVLADAVTEDLTTQLARVPRYFVIARTSAYAYKDQPLDVRTIREELGVAYALEGSLRRAGEQIRVTAQLIDTRSGSHVWAGHFDRDAESLLDLQNDLISEIVAHLGSQINLAEVRRLETRRRVKPSAMQHYNQAAAVIIRKGLNPDAVEESNAELREALELEPEFAPAMAQLALQEAIAIMTGRIEDTPEARAEIATMADRAVSLERDAPDVLGYAGCALCDIGEGERGLPLLDRALELDPSNAQAHAAKGASLILRGRFAEGVDELEAAVRISPKHPAVAFWLHQLGLGLQQLGRLDEARAALERARRYDADFLPAALLLARILSDSGETDAARELIAEVRADHPDLGPETLKRHGLDFSDLAGEDRKA
ncbi:hypothetical protein DDZ18_05660 [Marinicauda salina]|uniref:Uncharacterized protein n=1 Tax=Marinicauda salina TaxID=2135793 RepID=A0A2U2BT43_9PROT|nr:tetratricopeptide repeat protein [Marinicauda salina]PWE17183.1 hypothetical protein DDZ18_05660 [Marinicauda salina]